MELIYQEQKFKIITQNLNNTKKTKITRTIAKVSMNFILSKKLTAFDVSNIFENFKF